MKPFISARIKTADALQVQCQRVHDFDRHKQPWLSYSNMIRRNASLSGKSRRHLPDVLGP